MSQSNANRRSNIMKIKGLEYLIKIKKEELLRLEQNKNSVRKNNLKEEIRRLEDEYYTLILKNNNISISNFTFPTNNEPEYPFEGGKKKKSKSKSGAKAYKPKSKSKTSKSKTSKK